MSDAAKRTVRTVLQTALGIAIVLPAIVSAAGIPQALPWVAGALAVAGALTRVMALPGVQRLLPSWLRTTEARDRTVTLNLGHHGDDFSEFFKKAVQRRDGEDGRP
ncbi:hypothetical protein GCM10010497_46180 [Streptomyces cinereoruber]|uniref:Uncharacterized protein n=1 Tax=Streptomyces cinereoruber TaxID=67260 RepID=A0AAV4KQ42_9ACTN|nr:hypothetical protein [Streptomyces cinereoruber]NIH61025.1 hypothetical protein [Streptomyces cinereoruber]GGR38029.1 hypothetical protein GCM10010497_46180 [Streptomyces cinereoruber]